MDINISCEIIFNRTPTGNGAIKLLTSVKEADYAGTVRVFDEFRTLLAQAEQAAEQHEKGNR